MAAVKTPLRLDPGDPLSRGLVGFWPLTEAAGLQAADLGQQKRTGLLVNGPTRVASLRGRATRFDRTASQYVSVGTTLGFSAIDAMTVAAWAFIPTTSDHGAIFKIGNNTDFTGGDGFAFGIGNTFLENSGNNLLMLYEGSRWISTTIPAGTGWRHLAATIESAGTVAKLYLDGVLVFTDTGSAPKTVGGSGASIAQIGGYLGSSAENRYFTGSLIDERVWRRTLRGDEIRRLTTQVFAGTARDTNRVYSLPLATITADLAATLADATLSATATTTIQANADITLADATLSATAQVGEPEPDTGARGGDDAPARQEDIDRLARRRKRQEADQAARAARLRATLERAYRAATGEAVDEAQETLAEAVQIAPVEMRARIADVAPLLGTAQALAELRAILASMQTRRDMLAREDDELAFILSVL